MWCLFVCNCSTLIFCLIFFVVATHGHLTSLTIKIREEELDGSKIVLVFNC
jgi:hypothetical protein